MGIDFKTQTSRSTKMHRGIKNINLFCQGFEFGIVTTKYWGDMDKREEPLIELEIDGKGYNMPLSEFKAKMKKVLR